MAAYEMSPEKRNFDEFIRESEAKLKIQQSEIDRISGEIEKKESRTFRAIATERLSGYPGDFASYAWERIKQEFSGRLPSRVCRWGVFDMITFICGIAET